MKYFNSGALITIAIIAVLFLAKSILVKYDDIAFISSWIYLTIFFTAISYFQTNKSK